MSWNELLRRHRSKFGFVAGCLVGVVLVVLGLHLLPTPGTSGRTVAAGTATGNRTAAAFAPDPEYTLRLVQAIGILLPLFVGLLRLTTNDQSDVSNDVNKYLFSGISLLVFGGGFAALGGLLSGTAPVLKVALICVLLTFGVIGEIARTMSRQMPTESEDADELKRKTRDNEGTPDDDTEQTQSDPDSEERDDESDTDDETDAEEAEMHDYGQQL